MKQQLPSLNGLRAISIFLVLYAHGYLSVINFLHNTISNISPTLALQLFHNSGEVDIPGGQIGVNMFFVISGYLITLLLIKEEETKGFISLKLFYIRRTIRIFPVYYLLLIIYFIFQLLGWFDFTTNSWIRSITYSKDFPITGGSDWESGHLWSLSVEEHFYLLWPFLFKFLKNQKIPFAFLIIIVVTIVRLTTDLSHFHLFTRADALMWGCIFAIYNDSCINFLNNIYKKSSLFLLIPFVLLFVVLAGKKILASLGFQDCEHFNVAFLGSYGLLTDLCTGFIILISVNFSGNLWFKFLNSTLLNYIGKLSYSIYLWQQIFFSTKVGFLNTFPYNIIAIIIVANISFYLVEKPLLKLRTKFKA